MTDRERREMRVDLGRLIRGHRLGAEPADEREHFYTCAVCGQAVDKRDLHAVLHHEQPEHEPLPVN